MAFDPLSWLPLAEELGGRRDQASRRASIDRYYFAMFVQCRESLLFDGLIAVRGDDGDHRAVAEGLLRNKRATASLSLNNLRRMRNRADYDADATVGAADVARAAAHVAEIQRLCGDDWRRIAR